MSHGFELLRASSPDGPRRGRYSTSHGSFETPAFAPVGSLASVKGLLPEQVRDSGTGILLANTYHLALRPGSGLVAEAGGLHRFMAWEGPILTDSGGYQVFSLEGKRRVNDEGVLFAGPDSGRELWLSPAEALRIQRELGSDIAMALDVCPPAGASDRRLRDAHRRTLLWAGQARELHGAWGGRDRGQALFGIVQGGTILELRRESVDELRRLDFDGYALGGVSVGESKLEVRQVVRFTTALLPEEKIRYLMGVGEPDDLLEAVLSGIDLFDCVSPTRHGRTNKVYVPGGVLKLRNARHAREFFPIQEGCPCPACRGFTRAYLRHLALCKEMLAGILMSLHNLFFFQGLMAELRERIGLGEGEAELRNWFAGAFPGWAAEEV